jgi:diguanylate cyclase (GGDEF)-like protein
MAAIDELMKDMSKDSKDVLLLVRELASTVTFYQNLLSKFELDALTGLPGSNKYMDRKADIEKHSANLGVIAFDVNDLKYYNDTKGHQAGDRLLQKAAESFHAITSRQIEVFRTGGDEFVGIIWNCAEGDIDSAVASWQKKLAELNAVDDGIRCTIAWGAAFGTGEYKYEDVLAQADERMYAEKLRMKECGLKLGELR